MFVVPCVSDIYRDLPPGQGEKLLPAPSQRNINIAAANIDRFVGVLQAHREDEKNSDPLDELVTLMYAATKFRADDLKLMFAVMLQRLADQP